MLTKVAESRSGRFIRSRAITSVITIMGSMRPSPRNVKEQKSVVYQTVKRTSGGLGKQSKSVFWRAPSPSFCDQEQYPLSIAIAIEISRLSLSALSVPRLSALSACNAQAGVPRLFAWPRTGRHRQASRRACQRHR